MRCARMLPLHSSASAARRVGIDRFDVTGGHVASHALSCSPRQYITSSNCAITCVICLHHSLAEACALTAVMCRVDALRAPGGWTSLVRCRWARGECRAARRGRASSVGPPGAPQAGPSSFMRSSRQAHPAGRRSSTRRSTAPAPAGRMSSGSRRRQRRARIPPSLLCWL